MELDFLNFKYAQYGKEEHTNNIIPSKGRKKDPPVISAGSHVEVLVTLP